MKIEKVNDNQIRCTLTQEDLEDRHVKLSELVYGSDKARSLFKEMISQASSEVGFEAEDIPLMVEAIPISSGSIVLQITKVEYPEELDTRFSKFSEAGDEYYEDMPEEADNAVKQGAQDILDLFEEVKKETEENEQPKLAPAVVTDLTKMFEFRSLDQVLRLATVMTQYYQGSNDLYKDDKKNRYYLMVHKSEHTPAEFNKICNRISEYALQKSYTKAKEAYLNEHGRLIVAGNAIELLASL